MAILQFSDGIKFRYRNFRQLKEWLHQVMAEEGKYTGEINLVFVSDEYLLNINKKYLNHNYYTDVITFDYSDVDEISGDIFISIERIEENSGLLAVAFDDELDRVILHGILHLLKYDDSTKTKKQEMRRIEDNYLSRRFKKSDL